MLPIQLGLSLASLFYSEFCSLSPICPNLDYFNCWLSLFKSSISILAPCNSSLTVLYAILSL